MKNYQWRTSMSILSGGYPGEETGVNPNDQSWKTTDATSGSMTATYYYRDSLTASNNSSSRVSVTLQEAWTANIDSRNNLIIDLSTSITSIVRDDIRGSLGSGYFNIFVKRDAGSPAVWSIGGDQVNTAHTILGHTVPIGTYHFVLAPGEGLTNSSIYYRNNYIGHDNDPIPSQYVDVMEMGVEFKNILPADYRPGAIRDNDGVWQSHNRDAGEAHVLGSGGTWIEMRTVGGGVECGNPPSILKDDKWYNQLEIGHE